jgi:YHS domain-containing protein/thioredoxin-like negative regulator of GroEL
MHCRLFILRTGSLLLAVAALPAIAFGQASSVNWRTNLDQAKLEAGQSRRMLLIHFTTKTCGPCRLLDQQVFSQPHVGPAIEQYFVPVRMDADENMAIAKQFGIDRVPSEYVVSPQGQILANPPIPNQPGPYLEQLQNIARHFSQSAAAAATPATPAGVNSAYAALPVGQQAPAANPPQNVAPQVVHNPAAPPPQPTAQAAIPAQPQSQPNPYVTAAANPNTYGQAQNVYVTPPLQAGLPPAAAQQAAASSKESLASQQPVMPSNAMPNSYRNSGQATAAVSPAAASVVAAVAPKKPALPQGAPPLAFDGYCPVSLKTLNRWTEGDVQYGAVHRGRTYLFAGAEQRDQFLANPDSYSPVFAGLDPVLLLENQQSVEGSRALGYRYGDAFYLFSSEETKQKFAAKPHEYAAGVRQAMNRIDASAGGTVRR